MQDAAEQWPGAAWDRFDPLRYTADMNILYHQKRERFYALCDRWSKAVTLIAGTAAASAVIGSPEAKAWMGLIVAAVTLPALVFAWSDKARLHAGLRSQYVQVRADMEAAGVMNAAQIDAVAARLVRIHAEEPPALVALLHQCQNELDAARGVEGRARRLPWYQRPFVNVLSFS